MFIFVIELLVSVLLFYNCHRIIAFNYSVVLSQILGKIQGFGIRFKPNCYTSTQRAQFPYSGQYQTYFSNCDSNFI